MAAIGKLGANATLGGAVAAGLSGPRRPYAGAMRDIVLGVRMIDGRGEDLAFGGRVMKNVTGYDVARGLSGSWGTLAVMSENRMIGPNSPNAPAPEAASETALRASAPPCNESVNSTCPPANASPADSGVTRTRRYWPGHSACALLANSAFVYGLPLCAAV